MESQWRGKKVAFLGDSITDKSHVGTTKNYWQYLEGLLGIEAFSYGVNGDTWGGMAGQAKRLFDEHGDEIDAISIFAGTNDFNGGVPLGVWWTLAPEEVNNRCRTMLSPRRRFAMDPDTFRGRINIAMAFVKASFPCQQVFLVTPVHRAFAIFSPDNVQPDESFPNQAGLYADEYVAVVKEAGNVWAVPVVDLNATGGLFPLCPSHARFFHDRDSDLLHPGAEGHRRMALAMAYQMLAMPPDFK